MKENMDGSCPPDRRDPMTRWKLVPVEATDEMLARYGNALRNHIKAIPKEQRAGRWGASRPGRGYKVPDNEKAAARYSAMLSASPSPGEDVVERGAFTLFCKGNPNHTADELRPIWQRMAESQHDLYKHHCETARAVLKALEG